jgi:hypothetical protein
MKRRIATLVASGLFLLLPALSAATEAPLHIEIEGGTWLVPVDVVQTLTDRGIKVGGRIEKRSPYRAGILGHVDINVVNQDGEVILARKGALFGRSPSARNPDHAHFAITLDALPPAARAIRIRHHVGMC